MNSKKLMLITLLILGLFNFSQTVYAASDKIVAIVNDDIITYSEFQKNYVLAKAQFPEAQRPKEGLLKKQVLEDLINKKLLLQLGNQSNLNITQQEIDKTLASIAEQNKTTVANMIAQLKQFGVSQTDYRKEIKDQLIIQKMKQQQIAARVTITPEEIKRELKILSGKQQYNREYHIKDILVPLEEQATPEQISLAKTNAQQLIANLSQGKTNNEWQEEDLGFRALNDLPSAYVKTVANMRKPGLSAPILAANGVHVLRLEQINETKIDHSLLKQEAQNNIFQRKMADELNKWMTKLRADSYIDVPSNKA